jgi:hypothetical protein
MTAIVRGLSFVETRSILRMSSGSFIFSDFLKRILRAVEAMIVGLRQKGPGLKPLVFCCFFRRAEALR